MSGAMLPNTRAEAGNGVRRNGSTADGWLPVNGIALLATPDPPTPEYLPVLGSGTVPVSVRKAACRRRGPVPSAQSPVPWRARSQEHRDADYHHRARDEAHDERCADDDE